VKGKRKKKKTLGSVKILTEKAYRDLDTDPSAEVAERDLDASFFCTYQTGSGSSWDGLSDLPRKKYRKTRLKIIRRRSSAA